MSTNNTQEAIDSNRIDVVLALPHHHAGIDRKPGDSITVTPGQKQWLMQRGIIQSDNATGD